MPFIIGKPTKSEAQEDEISNGYEYLTAENGDVVEFSSPDEAIIFLVSKGVDIVTMEQDSIVIHEAVAKGD